MPYRVFLSHSSKDRDVTDAVHRELEAAGLTLFLDHHPDDGIVPGQAWNDRLHHELRTCDGVVAVLTDAWLDSKWCHTEAGIGQALRKPLIVLACGGLTKAVPAYLQVLQHLDLRPIEPGWAPRVVRALERLDADRPKVTRPAVHMVDRVAQRAVLDRHLRGTARPYLFLVPGERGQGHEAFACMALELARRDPKPPDPLRPRRWQGDAVVAWPRPTLPEAQRWAKLLEGLADAIGSRGSDEASLRDALAGGHGPARVVRHVVSDLDVADVGLIGRYLGAVWRPLADAGPWLVATFEVVLPQRSGWLAGWRRYLDRRLARRLEAAAGRAGPGVVPVSELAPLGVDDVFPVILDLSKDDQGLPTLTAEAARAEARRVLHVGGGRFEDILKQLSLERYAR